jgi:4-hydroxy-3-methylbut-2-en-1-yl diphosphate synthase IspG/GcpE
MVSKDGIIECPFCHKENVKVFHRPSYLQGKTSHISSGGKIRYHRVPETIEITCSCPDCGKSAKDIQNFFEGKKEIPHEERIERMKKGGIPTSFEEKVNKDAE